MKRCAVAAQIGIALLAMVRSILGRLGLIPALLLYAGVHGVDMARLGNGSFLRMPLRRVGLRELLLSATFSGLAVAGLWIDLSARQNETRAWRGPPP